jgi:hypothetical protein
MGFFSDIFDVAPHKTIGQKAYDYCVSSSLSEKELEIIYYYKANKERYIKIRNVGQISAFIATFQFLDTEYPKSRYGITYDHFQQLYWDYYHNSGEPTGWALWENQLEDFSLKIAGINFLELSQSEQNNFQYLINEYQDNITRFFKKHQRNLSEQIQ